LRVCAVRPHRLDRLTVEQLAHGADGSLELVAGGLDLAGGALQLLQLQPLAHQTVGQGFKSAGEIVTGHRASSAASRVPTSFIALTSATRIGCMSKTSTSSVSSSSAGARFIPVVVSNSVSASLPSSH